MECKAENPIGRRPKCFRNTFQEVLFVLLATVGMAMSTLLTGATVVVAESIRKDLRMSQSQLSWISAAST